MCTSFVFRKGNNVLTAMNFDTKDMLFSLKKDNKSFIVLAHIGKGKFPSFGVNSDGDFVNNLMVDSNGKGVYKRLSNKVIHTSKLTDDVLSGAVRAPDIKSYLQNVEYVNGPGMSVHNMIVNKTGDVCVVEPGRGIIYSPSSDSRYFIMVNFPLCDIPTAEESGGCGADRYNTAKHILENTDNLDVLGAFEILNKVKQAGEWKTAFSMVYSSNENAVYYCYDCNFAEPAKFCFT